tara:strand:- start:459 stop:608 length:150 start_codon:yes stop_codon:yes gene_type:complete
MIRWTLEKRILGAGKATNSALGKNMMNGYSFASTLKSSTPMHQLSAVLG